MCRAAVDGCDNSLGFDGGAVEYCAAAHSVDDAAGGVGGEDEAYGGFRSHWGLVAEGKMWGRVASAGAAEDGSCDRG